MTRKGELKATNPMSQFEQSFKSFLSQGTCTVKVFKVLGS